MAIIYMCKRKACIMRRIVLVCVGSLVGAMVAGSCSVPASAEPAMQSSAAHDGRHDFDFELGTWKFRVRKLPNALSGGHRWVELDGTSKTCRLWHGRAQIEQMEVSGGGQSIEGMTLRLYSPQTRQWSLYWATSKEGTMGGPPNIGEFKNGVGEFYADDLYEGRYVLIRYVWSRITPTSAHFEQSLSDDGGRTWVANWITDQWRVAPAADCAGGAP
jgi:hypothetical protein